MVHVGKGTRRGQSFAKWAIGIMSRGGAVVVDEVGHVARSRRRSSSRGEGEPVRQAQGKQTADTPAPSSFPKDQARECRIAAIGRWRRYPRHPPAVVDKSRFALQVPVPSAKFQEKSCWPTLRPDRRKQTGCGAWRRRPRPGGSPRHTEASSRQGAPSFAKASEGVGAANGVSVQIVRGESTAAPVSAVYWLTELAA